MANKLPTVKIGAKVYFVDARLRQLRNVDNPHDFVEMTDEIEQLIDGACEADDSMREQMEGHILRLKHILLSIEGSIEIDQTLISEICKDLKDAIASAKEIGRHMQDVSSLPPEVNHRKQERI
ncbi:MAG: hypothetical protein CSYNP_02844 [Syntrophus sp. SKADARSKE-3]|nr:hypothetical protein [Syntrophus sp. SKADARSKE-3]